MLDYNTASIDDLHTLATTLSQQNMKIAEQRDKAKEQGMLETALYASLCIADNEIQLKYINGIIATDQNKRIFKEFRGPING